MFKKTILANVFSSLATKTASLCLIAGLLAGRGCRFSVDTTEKLVAPDTPVFGMIVNGTRLERIQAALEQDKKVVNDFSLNGKSLLCYAAEEKRLDVAELLLQMGADVHGHVNRPRGVSPIYCAVTAEAPEIVDLLLKNGADPFREEDEFGLGTGISAYELGLESRSEKIVALMRKAEEKRKGTRGQSANGREN